MKELETWLHEAVAWLLPLVLARPAAPAARA